MNKNRKIGTERLILRRLEQADSDNLREILQDEDVMYTYEEASLVDSLTELWKASVRATHHFLTDEDIIKLIPFVKMGLNGIETLVVKFDKDLPIAFMGIEDHKIEMLFVTPTYFGKGIGRELIELALSKFAVEYVDVNEQNPQAAGFYKHIGFEVFERTELDDQGNPFPILKMRYANKG